MKESGTFGVPVITSPLLDVDEAATIVKPPPTALTSFIFF